MWMTDRPVLVLIVLLNATVLTRLSLRPHTVIGALNGSLAAAMLTLSVRSPERYARHRLVPVILLRLLVCALPLFSDTIAPFAHGLDSEAPPPPLLRRLGRALFMLLVSVSWAVGLFLASFLLLPPLQHLVVQAAALLPLLLHNRGACQHFLAQHSSNAAAVDTLEACLHTLVVSVAPVAQGELGAARPRAGRTASCMAGASALQVSLGLVLPTLLAWQLQSSTPAGAGMVVEQGTPPGGDAAAAQQRRCRGARLAAAVARNAHGWAAKLLFTGSSMLLTFSLCIEMLDRD